MKILIINHPDDETTQMFGFETNSIEELALAIEGMALRYKKDLPLLEDKKLKILKNKQWLDETKDNKIDAIMREPYMVRYGAYSIWAGEFVNYMWNGSGFVHEFVPPHIITLDQWFESISVRHEVLH